MEGVEGEWGFGFIGYWRLKHVEEGERNDEKVRKKVLLWVMNVIVKMRGVSLSFVVFLQVMVSKYYSLWYININIILVFGISITRPASQLP